MSAPTIVFKASDFVACYPEFANVSAPMLQNYFAIGNAYFQNNGCNLALASGIEHMTALAYMLTAHVAWILAPRDSSGSPASSGQAAPATVGQITNASEGSVSVTLKDIATGMNEGAAWFAQTKYGLMFWQATASYRTMQYVVNPRLRGVTPVFPFRGGRFF